MTNRASSISGNLDPYGRPIVDKKTTQVQQPTVAKPIVPPVQQVATQTPVQQVNTPTQTTTPQTQAFVPEPVKIDQSFIAFGDSARQRNEQDQTYLDTRNNMLAQWFASQNVLDEQQILNKLQSMSNFNTQPIEDQQNTAKSIASMIQQMQTGQQPTQEQPWQPQPQFTSQEMIDRATENTIQDEQQKFLQDVYRSGTIYDRNKEDLETNNRLIQQNLERKLEDTRIGVERQVDDIILQTERGVAWYEMVGALKGFNRWSWFVAGLVNIKDDANRTINRLQQDLQRYTDATGEAKEEAMKSLQQGMTRAKEDFEYAMRDVMQLAQIDMNSVVSKYGLSSEKMAQKLDTITLWVLQQRENLLSTYIANTKNSIWIVNDQLDLIKSQDDFIWQQRERFTSILDANDGAALSSMTPAVIQEYVNQWYLAPEQWVAYFELMKWKSIATLQANGKPTNEDVTQVMSLIDWGMTPAEAVAKIMQDNPDRYEAGAERASLPWGWGVLRRVWKDWKPEFVTWPQTTPWTPSWSPTQWPTPWVQYNPADPATLQTAMQAFVSQFPDGSDWTRDGYCWQFVNDYLKWAGVATQNLFLDPITQKQTLANSQSPTVWSIAIMDSPTDPQYWHVGIVTKVNADGSFVMKESNYVSPWKVSTRTIPAWWATYGFFDPTVTAQQSSWPIWPLWIPISYERSVKNLVPATLMNSEVELKQLNETIQSMHKSGIPEEDAALFFMWFNIQDEANKSLAKTLVWVGRSLPDEMWATYVKTISDFINSWNTKWAVQKAETTAMSQAKKIEWDNFISESNVRTAYDRATKLEGYIDWLDSSPIGVVSGTIEWRLWKLKGKEAQAIRTQVTQMVAKLRSDLVGANVTEWEERMIEPLIPALNDTPANFMIKLQNLKTAPLAELNSMRETYWLPQLDWNTLLNSANKINLYTWKSTQPTNTNNTQVDISKYTNRFRN